MRASRPHDQDLLIADRHHFVLGSLNTLVAGAVAGAVIGVIASRSAPEIDGG
jgi:hypothetical protein